MKMHQARTTAALAAVGLASCSLLASAAVLNISTLSTHADRVKHFAPSDYRPNTHLRLVLEQMVEEIADRIVEQRNLAIETGTVRAPKH